MKGRGASSNPAGRFERLAFVPDESAERADRPQTEFYRDASRTAVSFNESPDVGFDASVNPYRGCEHGCVYCYARPTHEYLGFSAGLDFETRILVKEDAPELLRCKLASRSWEPQIIALSGVTDPYQPAERKLEITRQCLEVLLDFRNPAAIVTKSALVTRDADLFVRMARYDTIAVNLSITSLDPGLQRKLEPRASSPAARLQAVAELSRQGIPVRVLVAPVIPSLNDHEIPAILEAAAEAGARQAGYILLRLPHGVKALMDEWLLEHHPLRRERVLGRVREVRAGRLNDPDFGTRMRGTGKYAEQIRQLFEVSRRKAGLEKEMPKLSTEHFRRPGRADQLGLF